MSLYSQIASYNNLISGFHQVKESDGAAGYDRETIIDFENFLEQQIYALHRELTQRIYKPKPVIFFEKKKADGKMRLLSIFSVRDRVVQASAMKVLNPLFESEFENESFGYRKGRSREAAAKEIYTLFNKGYKWIVDADIRSYFDSVNHDLLFNKLEKFIDEKDVTRLIRKWVQAECIINSKKKKIKTGLLQGSVISPMLANFYLDELDEKLKQEGFKLIRYADDFVILTKEKPEAEEALELTRDSLKQLKLELNPGKTKITTFEHGFKYLGYLFVNSLIVPASPKDTSRPIPGSRKKEFKKETLELIDKLTEKERKEVTGNEEITEEKLKATEMGTEFLEALKEKGVTLNEFLESTIEKEAGAEIPQDKEVEEALLSEEFEIETDDEITEDEYREYKIPPQATALNRSLYIQEQGAFLKKEGGRLVVEKESIELLEVPAIKIAHIIIFGNCTVTPAAAHYCLRNRIPVTLLSSRGKYYGSIETTFSNNADLERLQLFRTLDENFILSFAKKIIKAKINNQRILLTRYSRKKEDEEINKSVNYLARLIKRIENSNSIDDIRGFEGVAASSYFKVFGRLFQKNSGFYNEKFYRNKRPPLDPVNSLLSFGYTILGSNIYSFVKARGINPYCGFMHAFRAGHPALVSDLMEEFRFVIDMLALQLLNHKILTNNDFYFAKEPGAPCYLTNNGRKIFIKQLELKFYQKVKHKETGFNVDYRKCFDLQVQQFTQFLRGEKENYNATKLVK
ncbi:MAG: CRISPR-associated endonuclease Cas1 [Ignavibacteria bacterium]